MKNTTDKLRAVGSSRLVRLRAGSIVLLFEPPLICDCGGEVEVKDWRGEASKGGRYQAWCNGCKSCDPNGWGSQREVIANSPGYFQTANKPDAGNGEEEALSQ